MMLFYYYLCSEQGDITFTMHADDPSHPAPSVIKCIIITISPLKSTQGLFPPPHKKIASTNKAVVVQHPVLAQQKARLSGSERCRRWSVGNVSTNEDCTHNKAALFSGESFRFHYLSSSIRIV